MKFKRRFYDSPVSFRNISKEQVILAIVICLVFAFTIYSFFYVFRESFRVMSFGFGHLPNILGESERNFYNIFFAALAMIFGNSIAISFVFSRPQNIFLRHNIKRSRILNDQIFLNLYFFYWFAKIGLVFGIFSMGFTDFNFHKDFTIPIILLLVVLYLESWKTLSTIFRKKRFKYQVLHLFFMIFFIFGLSRIELVNYRVIDENQLKYTPMIDLPKSKYDNVSYYESYLDVYLNVDNNGKLLFGYYENDLVDSHLDFLDFKLKLFESFQEKTSIRISANYDTKMSTIKSIEKQVKKANVNYIIYGTFENDLYAKRFSSSGIKIMLNDSSYYEDNIEKRFWFYGRNNHFYEVEKDFKPTDTLKIKISKDIFVNDLIVPDNMLVKKFKKRINQKTIFEYEFSLDVEYQYYIKVLSAHLKAIDLIRKENIKVELEWEEFKHKNKSQYIKDQQRLRNEFPFRIIEKLN